MSIKKSLLIGLLMLGCTAMAAVNIRAIKVESTAGQERQEILEQIVSQTVTSKVGAVFDPKVVSGDIVKLIKSGKFDDVKIRTENQSEGKLTLVYVLKPKPFIRKMVFKGCEFYSAERIANWLNVKEGDWLDDKSLADARKKILDKYTDSGYHKVQVHTRRENEKDGAVDLVFDIKEETRQKLKQVYFENNHAFEEGDLRPELATRRQWWRYIFRFGNYYNSQNVSLDKDKLKQFYAKYGYMDFVVKEVREELIDDGAWVKVIFVLDEGKPYTVGKINVVGNETFSSEALLKHSHVRSGDIHSSDRETADIDSMKALYERLGYLDLRFYATYKKDTNAKIVDVTYHVSEGTPSRIRDIVISGNEITKDEVIRRELAIAPTDLGDNGKIRASKNRLMNLGYFETVEILPVATGIPNTKDLRIELKEKPTGQLSLGAGFSTEDSGIAFIEFSETNFDLARLFDWPPKGDGQRLKVRMQFGSSLSNFTVSHIEPWFLDRRLELSTDFFYRLRAEDEYDQRNMGFGQMLSWPIALRIPLTEHIEEWRMGVGYRVESVKISDADKHNPAKAMTKGDFVKGRVVEDEEGNHMANRLLWRVTRDTRDRYLYPTSGSITTFQTEFVTHAIGSYADYVRFNLGYSKYIPVFRDFVLKLNADYSSSTGDTPGIFDRYFAGGVGSVRGFKRRDVAPVDCYEDPMGGNSMLTGTIELIKPVANFMYVSTFLDAGNVWWDEFQADVSDMNYSVGVGVQFKALPISIYYGYPISTSYDHLEDRSGRIHFNIGITY